MKNNPKIKKVSLISLGCSKALVDSESLMGQLKASNIEVEYVENPVETDALVINTCGFINDAKQESIDTILDAIKAKQEGKVGSVHVMGCLSQRYMKDLEKEIPDVDQYFGVNDIQKIVSSLGGDYKYELVGERKLTTPSHFAYVKISEGCDRRCTFCAIPKIRGKHKSRPIEEIISEVRRLIAKGVKEIILIAQDLTYYGIDLYKKNRFADLLEALSDINGLKWIRLHYTYPSGFPEEILPLIRERENICNYIDMPIQHINSRLLGLMQRGHTREGTIKLLEKIRDQIPGIALRTTIIVGFPGETEEEFQELCDFVREFKFNRLGVFTYSHEENTTAYKLEDNVPEDVKQKRLEKLMDLQQEISLENNQKLVGQEMMILIDRRENDYFVGRTFADSPEVDNEVLIPATGKKLLPGTFCTARITSADHFDLFAETI